MATARDIITRAAQTAGVVSPLESVDSLEASHALHELNSVISTWNMDELFPYVNETYTLSSTITPGKILIGPTTGSVDIEAPRPERVVGVAIVVDGLYRPLSYVSQNTLAQSSIRNSNPGSQPIYYSYSPSIPDMEIEVFPATSAYGFRIEVQKVVQAVTLNDELPLPAGYLPALQYELASILAVQYGNFEVVQQLEKMAIERLSRVKRLNNKPTLMRHDGTPRGAGQYDIYTDGYV